MCTNCQLPGVLSRPVGVVVCALHSILETGTSICGGKMINKTTFTYLFYVQGSSIKTLTLPALGLLIEVRKRQNQGEFILKVWNYGLIVCFAFCHFSLYSPALICRAEQLIRMKLAFIQCVIKLRLVSAVGFSVICLITFNHHFAWNMQYLDLCGWRRAFMFAIRLKCSPWGVMSLKKSILFSIWNLLHFIFVLSTGVRNP